MKTPPILQGLFKNPTSSRKSTLTAFPRKGVSSFELYLLLEQHSLNTHPAFVTGGGASPRHGELAQLLGATLLIAFNSRRLSSFPEPFTDDL